MLRVTVKFQRRGGQPPSELPKLFFYLHELLGDLGDDAVVASQSIFERLDLMLEVLLSRRSGPARFQRRGRVVEQLALPLIEETGLGFGIRRTGRRRVSCRRGGVAGWWLCLQG